MIVRRMSRRIKVFLIRVEWNEAMVRAVGVERFEVSHRLIPHTLSTREGEWVGEGVGSFFHLVRCLRPCCVVAEGVI